MAKLPQSPDTQTLAHQQRCRGSISPTDAWIEGIVLPSESCQLMRRNSLWMSSHGRGSCYKQARLFVRVQASQDFLFCPSFSLSGPWETRDLRPANGLAVLEVRRGQVLEFPDLRINRPTQAHTHTHTYV